jgi:hypothetical protein
MRMIRNECGGGRTTVSTGEALRGWIRCSACGKVLKIRANRNLEAAIPLHSRQEKDRHDNGPEALRKLFRF